VSKRFKDLSFQSKLFLTNLAIVLLVVIIITVVMTHNASQMISRSYYASLHLLTEQASVTFGENLNNLQNALFSSSLTSQVGDCMRRLQELQGQGSAYRQASSDLQFALSTMMGSSSMYDSVSVRLPDGECFGSQSSFAQITAFIAISAAMIAKTTQPIGFFFEKRGSASNICGSSISASKQTKVMITETITQMKFALWIAGVPSLPSLMLLGLYFLSFNISQTFRVLVTLLHSTL